MKYVRTKDTVVGFEENQFNDEYGNWLGYHIDIDNINILLRFQGVAIANTIEELCDAIVYYDCDFTTMHTIFLAGKHIPNFKQWFNISQTGRIKDIRGCNLDK